MTTPLLSIIVPVYQAEEYLSACIESILLQDYSTFELILVDDGSTDQSGVICDYYAKQDERIRVIHKKNGGQSSARNRGLDIATGQYITFVDSDDTIAPGTYKRNLQLLEQNTDWDILQYPFHYMYGNRNGYLINPTGTYLSNNNDRSQLFCAWLQKKRIYSYMWNKIFRNELFRTLRFREDIIYEDRYLMCHLLANCKGVHLSLNGLYYYYDRPGATTKRKLSAYVLRSLVLAELNIVKHIESYPTLKEVCINRYYNCLYYSHQLATNAWSLDDEIKQEIQIHKPRISDILFTSVPIGIKLRLLLGKCF